MSNHDPHAQPQLLNPSEPVAQPHAPSWRQHMRGARFAMMLGDLAAAVRMTTLAIETDPRAAEGYQLRALCRRMDGDLQGAIADYTHVIEHLDPGRACCWEFRGATRASLAAGAADEEVRSAWLAAAEADYRQAQELDPDEDRLRLALIETSLCANRPTFALAHAGVAWNAVTEPGSRLVCAWLGSLAALACVADLPDDRAAPDWRHYRAELERRAHTLDALAWSLVEVNGWIRQRDEAMTPGWARVRDEVAWVHELFLSHFEAPGPRLA